MNATTKKISIVTLIFIFVFGAFVLHNSGIRADKPTTNEQCRLGSLDACRTLSLEAKAMKDEAVRLWEFADQKMTELLSWTNRIHNSQIEKLK